MENQNKNLLNVEVLEKKSKAKEKFQSVLEGICEVYFYILKNPFDNFAWECISILIQYIQLIIFIFNKTVSYYFFKNYYVVFECME